jgi:hypothetical protein
MSGRPPSPTANETTGPYILASLWTMDGLAGAFLFMRLFTKIYRRRGLWWDDFLLFMSWV